MKLLERVCPTCHNIFNPYRNNKVQKYCGKICWLKSSKHRKVASSSWKGKTFSMEMRNKMSLAKKGIKQSDEHIKNRVDGIRKNSNYKWKKSTINKRSLSLKGKKRTGKSYINILNSIAKSRGYKDYNSMPHLDNPDWRGVDWKSIREIRKTMDNHICQVINCNKTKKLQVHHIVDWRKTKDNSFDNLITLCISHHQSMKGRNKKLPLLDGRILESNGY